MSPFPTIRRIVCGRAAWKPIHRFPNPPVWDFRTSRHINVGPATNPGAADSSVRRRPRSSSWNAGSRLNLRIHLNTE